MLQEIQKRLREAENIEEEKEKMIKELEALRDIIKFFQTLEGLTEKREEPQRPSIDWNKIFDRINTGIDVIRRGGAKAWKKLKEIDQEAGRMARGIEKKEKKRILR